MKPVALVALAALAFLSAPGARADEAPSMTLAQAYRLALAHSDRVAIARAAVGNAQIQDRATWNEITPTISSTTSETLQRGLTNNNGAVAVPTNRFITAVTLQQPVFRRDFGALRSAAGSLKESARASLARARQSLARDVADAYIAVVKTREVRDLDSAAVARTQALEKHTARRVHAGGALPTAQQLAEIDVQTAQRRLLGAQEAVGIAEAAFTRLVGRAPPPGLALPSPPAVPDRAQALTTAKRRPDLRALEEEIAEADANVKVSRRRRWWPKLDVTASGQFYSPPLYGQQSVEWQVMGVLTIPLLQGGSEYTAVKLNENAAHVATLELEAQRRQVTDEVRVAAVEVKTSAQTADLAEQQLTTAQKHYKLVTRQFRLGATTFLNVSNAEAVLSDAENAEVTAKADHVRALYDYLSAIGALDLDASKRGAPN